VDDKWRILTRVRDIRARVAQNEVMRERKSQARAQAALEQARQRKALLEEQAVEASRQVAAVAGEGGESTFDAVRAQEILDFVAGARLQAHQANTPIRRAQLLCDRAQETVDRVSANYRREVGRKETVDSHWQEILRTARRRHLEREDEQGSGG
jgi:hypothetical protein